jgi:acetyl-CoA carboxylase carboxyltransferase component
LDELWQMRLVNIIQPLMHLSLQGRRVMAIANDITFQSGAFSPREDTVFRAATEMALELHIPVVYLAANSGG